MFKNPLSKYQQGGQVSQEQQEMIAAFVEWLPTAVKEFAGMESEQVIEALNGISKTEDGQKQVQVWVKQFQSELQNKQNSLFKRGGKLHAFICRHAKGGHIADCGCKEDGGKVEKHQEGKWVSADKTITITNPGTAQADTTGTYSYTNRHGEFRFKPNGERTITEWFDGDFLGNRYASQEWFKNHPYKNAIERMLLIGRKPLTADLEENARQRVANRTNVQKDQNGTSGVPTNASALENYLLNNTETPNTSNLFTGKQVASLINNMHLNQPLVQVSQSGGNLSRRDALEAAQSLYGYDRNQAIQAYANAKAALRKQGIRGDELRQKARLMISRRQSIPTLEKIEAQPITTLLQTPEQKVEIKRPEIKNNYDNMSFSNAFRAARNIANNGGQKTFNWRGKSYGTNLASTPKPPVISHDIEIKEPEIMIDIPDIVNNPINIPFIPATREARSIRTINSVSIAPELSGAGQQVYSTMKSTTQTPEVITPVSRVPMGEVETMVGTGYMPLIPQTEEDVLARLQRSARTSEREINDSKMPPLWLGRYNANPKSSIKPNLIYNQVQ